MSDLSLSRAKNTRSRRMKNYGVDESTTAPTILTLMTVVSVDDDTAASCDGTSVLKTTFVTFEEQTRIYIIPSKLDLPKEEITRLWYASEEYAEFNEQCESSANKVEKGIRLNPKRHTSHGLEAWTREGSRRQNKQRNESLHVVLDEQFAQWDEGVDDHESIAELYQARCQHAQMVAVTRALMLEREVQEAFAWTVIEYPSLFEFLRWNECSPFTEKVLAMARVSSSSSSTRSSRSIKSLSTRSSRSLRSSSKRRSKDRPVSDAKKSHPEAILCADLERSPTKSPQKKRSKGRTRVDSMSPKASAQRQRERQEMLASLFSES